MIIIIRDELLNPPTWFSSFRDLTLICSLRLQTDILIESSDIDLYYHWLKARGGMDFVDDFVRPGSEDGLRLDTEYQFDPSIVTDRIVPENTHLLFQRIQNAVGF
ncbi:hypothetical protein VDG1235_3589 [Verrucomicrobiia bacterium DG1235]|nr:hypothetical protein VDG1235_3589 [Verrucomicrobiae bacterium DG1235]